jgi:hypothetical protein
MFYLLTLLVFFGISTLWWGGITWILCWLLTSLGITTICGWTVAFSWKLVLILAILSAIFSPKAKG